jgi:hypothetical protein
MTLSFFFSFNVSLSSQSSSFFSSLYYSLFNVFNEFNSLYDSKLFWNAFHSNSKLISKWELLLYDWDQNFDIKMNEIIKTRDNNERLWLQRELLIVEAYSQIDELLSSFLKFRKISIRAIFEKDTLSSMQSICKLKSQRNNLILIILIIRRFFDHFVV